MCNHAAININFHYKYNEYKPNPEININQLLKKKQKKTTKKLNFPINSKNPRLDLFSKF